MIINSLRSLSWYISHIQDNELKVLCNYLTCANCKCSECCGILDCRDYRNILTYLFILRRKFRHSAHLLK